MTRWRWHKSNGWTAKGAGLMLIARTARDGSWLWSVYEDADAKLIDRAHAPGFLRARTAAEAAANRYLERL